jgi:hypothetical protein
LKQEEVLSELSWPNPAQDRNWLITVRENWVIQF